MDEKRMLIKELNYLSNENVLLNDKRQSLEERVIYFESLQAKSTKMETPFDEARKQIKIFSVKKNHMIQ